MRIEFCEEVPVDPETVFGFFRSPSDWTRLYRAFVGVRQRRDGSEVVRLRRFPIGLVTRMADVRPPERAAWTFDGFFAGRGEVRLSEITTGTRIEGYEEVSIPSLLGLGALLERRLLAPRFRAIWAQGWRTLRAATSDSPLPPPGP